MDHGKNRWIRLLSATLATSIFMGFLPWQELQADANTHGEYDAYPFEITYEQNSTWNNSTQGTIELTNTTEYSVTSWSLEIDYFEDVTLSNIWNVTGSISDGNVIVDGSSEIEPGQTFTFGIVVDGEDSNPVAPIDINTTQYISDEPEITPMPEPTPEITGEPTISPEITEEPSVSPTITEDPTLTDTPTLTVTPTPVEDEQEIFPYAIFSGSTTDDFSFRGWKSDILGDVYSGRDFLYQGSELYMEGYARTVGVVNPSGWITDMTGAEEGIDPLEMPDWSESILAKEDIMPLIDPVVLSTGNSIITNGFYYYDGDITIDSSLFSGDGDIVIVANGNITYNVDTISSNNEENEQTGRILLYSEEGDITINGSQIEITGILYAPNGRVSINAYNTTINGRIVADRFSYNGSILNVYYFSPTFILIIFQISAITDNLTKKPKESLYCIPLYICQFIALLIHLEILELNFCGLNKYTKKNINLRGINDLLDEGRDSVLETENIDINKDYAINVQPMKKYDEIEMRTSSYGRFPSINSLN